MERDTECQHHANCGGYCEDEEQRSMALCEHCLEAYHEREADEAELKALRTAMGQLGASVGLPYVAGNSPAAIVEALTKRLRGREALAAGRDHLTVTGSFQSDKYEWCAAGFVPLKLTDPSARDLLIRYAGRHSQVDGNFTRDLLEALKASPFEPGAAGMNPKLFPKAAERGAHE